MWSPRSFSSSTDARRSPVCPVWLLGPALVLLAPVAYTAWGGADPTYAARGNLWVKSPPASVPHPVRTASLREGYPAVELLRSYRVLEAVALEHRLHLRGLGEHAPAFADFGVFDDYRPGSYELRVGASGGEFMLLTGEGAPVERGVLGEPIGQSLGFDWAPRPGSFDSGATVTFSLLTLRAAAETLSGELTTETTPNFVGIELTDPDPQKAVDVVDALMEEVVHVSGRLHAVKLEETLKILQQQLEAVEDSLVRAERDLDAFRRSNATSPLQERRLERRLRSIEELYANLRVRVEDVRLARATTTPDIGILDPASVSGRPIDDLRLPIMVAMLVGWLAGLAGVARVVRRRHIGLSRARSQAAPTWGEDAGSVLAIVVGAALAVLLTALIVL